MLALLVLAFGLAMDAVAVSLVRGASGEHRLGRALEVGLFFGIAQGLMPLIGWALGVALAGWIAAIDHWIAFGLLAFLGLKMIREALADDDGEREAGGRSYFAGLAVAAVATSIDAAAAGITLPTMGAPITLACTVIGGVTALLCASAYWIGNRVGARAGQRAEIAGGVVLILLGAKILFEHLSA